MTTKIGIHYTGYWDKEFVDECIKDAQQVAMIYQALGEPVTPLQKLAYNVLKENGYFQQDIEGDF